MITWLGTPRRATPRGGLGDPVPACPPGMVWSSSQVKCVPGPQGPGPQIEPLHIVAQVCPEGWKWHATYGECVPPQDATWPQAKCPDGYKFDNKVLYCVPIGASTATSSESKTPAALIVAGLVLAAIVVGSAA